MINRIEDLENGVFFAARGGGIRSCTSIGALKALEEARIPIKGISGESLSSLVVSLYCYGYKAEEILEIFLEYNEIITKASKLFGGRGSIVIEEAVNKVTNNMKFKDLGVDCYINACTGTISNPEVFVFSKENTPEVTLGRACRASASIPILFGNSKLIINGKEYDLFDGGFLYNPYIPETKYPIIYSSFHNDIDYYKILPFLKKTVDYAYNKSDIIIYTPVGRTLVIGSNDEMIDCAEAGYQETKRILRL